MATTTAPNMILCVDRSCDIFDSFVWCEHLFFWDSWNPFFYDQLVIYRSRFLAFLLHFFGSVQYEYLWSVQYQNKFCLFLWAPQIKKTKNNPIHSKVISIKLLFIWYWHQNNTYCQNTHNFRNLGMQKIPFRCKKKFRQRKKQNRENYRTEHNFCETEKIDVHKKT